MVSTSFPGSSLFLPREAILVTAGHVTGHIKLLPSRGRLSLLFCSQEPYRAFQAAMILAREMREQQRGTERTLGRRLRWCGLLITLNAGPVRDHSPLPIQYNTINFISTRIKNSNYMLISPRLITK